MAQTSSPPTSPDRRSSLGKQLGLKAEVPDESGWKLSMIAENAAKEKIRLEGLVSARRMRDIIAAHRVAMDNRRTELEKMAKKKGQGPLLAKSPINVHKRITGERRPPKMPIVGLHPVYGVVVRILARIIAYLLDGLCLPFSKLKARKVVYVAFITTGIIMLVIALPLWLWLMRFYDVMRRSYGDLDLLLGLIRLVRNVVPVLLASWGVMGVVAGIRFGVGRSYRSLLSPWYAPAPAWKGSPMFWLGGVKRLLSDFYEGTICFGGIGSGKTVSLISPLLMQMFRQLNNPNSNAVDARFFALMLDVKGNFADLVVYLMIQVKRPLTDLIIVDPDLDLYRYNPLDPHAPDYAERGAATLAAVNRIMGNESKGDNVYWDQTSQNVIRAILKNLSIVRPKNRIGLDDIGRFVRDDDRVGALLKQARAVLEIKRRNNQISADDYNEMLAATSELQNNWAKLDGRTKNILKTTVQNMLGPIPNSPRLQRIFCRDTNFSMKSVINEGKIVIFRARTIDPQTARMLAVCLKRDFQIWTKRRVGAQGIEFGLNKTRSGMFVADEFQELVSCGAEGDESYFGLCREARIICLVATQMRSSLDVAIKNEAQLKTLLGNLTTKVFLKLSDRDTQELGAFLGGKSYHEREKTTVHKASLLGNIASPVDKGGSKDHSTHVDEHLEDNFRPDDFARLQTVARNRSMKGPWYSEAIIFNYAETDREKVTWAVKTRLPHLYPNPDEKDLATMYLDDLLYARNAQSRVLRLFYAVAASGRAARAKVEIQCRDQQGSVRLNMQVNEQRRRDAAPQSEAERQVTVRERFRTVEKQRREAEAELRAYERTKGKHGRDYQRLSDRYLNSCAEYTTIQVQVLSSENPNTATVLLGGKHSTEALLKDRGVEALRKRASNAGIPATIKEGTTSDLNDHGPSAGVSAKPDNADALILQQSAIPGMRSAVPPPPLTPSSLSSVQPKEAASPIPAAPAAEPSQVAKDEAAKQNAELDLLIQALSDNKEPTGYLRQIQQHSERFKKTIESDYDRRFGPATASTASPEPPTQPSPSAAPAAPPAPPPLAPPTCEAPKNNAEQLSAMLDRLAKTTDEDYA